MTLQSFPSVFRRRLAVASALFLSLGAMQQAHATTFTVTNTNDSGAGSLRQAVLDANAAPSNDIITFNTGNSITLSTGELELKSNGTLTIVPQGFSTFGLLSYNSSRIFNIDSGANVTLNKLNLGNAVGPFGGAINNNGTLTVNNCTFSSNSAPGGYGGAIHNPHGSTLTLNGCTFSYNTSTLGGAIYNGGTATITDSAFRNNSASNGGSGGAINSNGGMLTLNNCTFSGNEAPGGSGGAVSNGATLITNTSTFSSNSADNGSGGAISNGGTSTINSSTFSDNSASGGSGGAIGNGNRSTVNNSTFSNNSASGGNGGAISNGSISTVNNSTFSGNTTPNGFGGAIYNPTGTSIVSSSTLSGNSATNGGGGAIFSGSNSTLVLHNSIVAGNSVGSGGNSPNISGTATGGDFNLVNDTAGATLAGTHNITGQDPKLGSLTDNGGPTKTIALLSGSPAIDAGDSPFETDQRGGVRPYDEPSIANAAGGNGSDIGAFESDAPSSSAPIVINTTDDSIGACSTTNCSLREAIQAANNNPDISTITFDPAVFATKRSIGITTTLPTITSSIILTGPSAPGTGVTLQNTTETGLLSVRGGTLQIANLTLTSSGTSGITNFSGTVTANSCTFSSNNIGIKNGEGGSQLSLNLIVNNCTFIGNGNSAIYSDITTSNNSVVSVNSCTLTGNGYGVYVQTGALTLSNSIVVDSAIANIATASGTINGAHNITTGTGVKAGLDPAGLKDNGGPTPTIALVPRSHAINTGATTLTTDQRGQLRGTLPDIGAFELNSLPSVISVSPQGASDTVGAKRTFTLTMSDANGAKDIREMWLLINRQLDWTDGATLIYRPSTSSPTNGQLFLREGEDFLPPITIGAGASSRAVLDNGAVRVTATDVSASVSGNAITLTLPLTIRDGLVGQNGLFARVQDTAGATDPSAQAGNLGFVREGTYTITSQIAGANNSAPTLSKLTPGVTNTALNSSGLAPTAQNFGFFVQDPDGIGDIDSVWFLANKTRGWNNNATFIYYPRTRRLVLRSDDGNSFLGGVIGSPGIIENSQVRVDLSKVKVTIVDGKSLGITLPLQAKTGLIGQNGVWLRVQDTHGATSPDGDELGFVRKGNWNVKANTAGDADAKPSNGNS